MTTPSTLPLPFSKLAPYYDRLYGELDTAREADFVARQLRQQNPNTITLLNLGCGTGRHDRALTELGFIVTGVDRSPEMIHEAKRSTSDRSSSPNYRVGDCHTFREGKLFDGVISLFHVMSYQLSDDDLRNTLITARTHLDKGGIFLFDAWFGPGVISDPPTVREKTVQDNALTIRRQALPTLHPTDHRVDIHYTFTLEERGERTTFEERHSMRYLFPEEITTFAEETGFTVITLGEWLKDTPPTSASWNAYWVLLAR